MGSEPSTGELMGRVTAEEINSLPEHLRRYVRDLETICDPAGMVQEIAGLKMQVAELAARYERGKAEGVREEREAEAAKSCETCGRNTGPETGLCPSSKCPRCRRNDPMEDYWISRTEVAQPPVQADGKGGA